MREYMMESRQQNTEQRQIWEGKGDSSKGGGRWGIERRREKRTEVEGKWKETEERSGNERRGEENMKGEEN